MIEFKTDEKRLFEFAVDGEQYSLPTFDSFKVDEVAEVVRGFKAEKDKDAATDKLNDYVRGIFEEHAPGVCERLTLGQYNELVKAYFKASRLDVGKS